MQLTVLLIVLIALTVAGYHLGRSRAVRAVGGRIVQLHSVPAYHGAYVALWAGLPALLLFVVWSATENWLVLQLALGALPERLTSGVDIQALSLLKADILNIAQGVNPGRDSDPAVIVAAQHYNDLRSLGDWMILAFGSALAAGGLVYARNRIDMHLRARNRVEQVVNIALIACAMVAILTTFGIVFSLVFEAMQFFTKISPIDFLFGLHWSPQTAMRADQVGSSGSFGAVPLFAGTLLITFIAMLVAVPVGLMAAVFMSEYADPKLRNWVKPILEILAGIPTVVYGFFAALTMAPFVRGLGESIGLSVSSESALAAGLVMGVMITVTTQIATLLVGDQEFDSPKTLSAFGLGLVLFVVTLALNMIALRVVQKYREKYD